MIDPTTTIPLPPGSGGPPAPAQSLSAPAGEAPSRDAGGGSPPPAPEASTGGAAGTVTRVFRAELRRLRLPASAAAQQDRAALLARIRRVAADCAQFGNELLSANYLLYRHGWTPKGPGKAAEQDARLMDALAAEARDATGRYRQWGDRLNAYTRDAVTRMVTGLVKSKGREVLRGEAALPTFHRRGALRVRERGVRLWAEGEGNARRLFCSLSVLPNADPMVLELWVRGLRRSPRYAAILEKLLAGTYPITQAQLLLVQGFKVSIRLAYSVERPPVAEGGTAAVGTDLGLMAADGAWRVDCGREVADLARRKAMLEQRRVAAYRLIAGRRLRRRWPRRYRPGTLGRLHVAWTNLQRTWAQQYAAWVVRECRARRVAHLILPSTGLAAQEHGAALDWTVILQAVANKCEEAGIRTSQIQTEREQQRDLRKQEQKARRDARKKTMDSGRVPTEGS